MEPEKKRPRGSDSKDVVSKVARIESPKCALKQLLKKCCHFSVDMCCHLFTHTEEEYLKKCQEMVELHKEELSNETSFSHVHKRGYDSAIDDEAIPAIGHLLLHMKKLRDIHLCWDSEQSGTAIVNSLVELHELQEIFLEGDISVAAFTKFLKFVNKRCPKIRKIKFSSNPIIVTQEQCGLLIYIMKKPELEELDLDFIETSYIRDENLKNLARAMTSSKSLHTLSLSVSSAGLACHIMSRLHVDTLYTPLNKISSLTVGFCDTDLSEEQITQACRGVELSLALRHLKFGTQNLDKEAEFALLQAAVSNPHIKTVTKASHPRPHDKDYGFPTKLLRKLREKNPSYWNGIV